jgi:hypothetical protein
MNTRMKVAFIGYLLALLLITSFGFVYLLRPEFMSYHAAAMGMPWEDVPRGTQIIIIALMKSYGGAELALALALFIVLWFPFRKGEVWAKYAIPAAALVYTIPALYVTLHVRASTPAEPPWIAVVVGIVLVMVSFILSLTDK